MFGKATGNAQNFFKTYSHIYKPSIFLLIPWLINNGILEKFGSKLPIVKVTSLWNRQDYRICHRPKRVLGRQLVYSTLCCLGIESILWTPLFDRNLFPLCKVCKRALTKPKAIPACMLKKVYLSRNATFGQNCEKVHFFQNATFENRFCGYYK